MDYSDNYSIYIVQKKTYPLGNLAGAREIITVSGHQYQLAGGYDLEIGHF